MANLLRPTTAKITITVDMPDGSTLSASGDVDTGVWHNQATREYYLAQTTRRVLSGLCKNWGQLRRSVR
jgi:hypothetical protein